MSVQAVTFYPVAPVRPVVRSSDEQESQKSPSPTSSQPAASQAAPQSAGRLLDIKV
jgi:hypothetical protein